MNRSVLFLLAALIVWVGCGKNPVDPGPSPQVIAVELRAGTGTTAAVGRIVTVHYTGWLLDAARPESKGTQFETSVGASPYTFLLGFGQVIPGWDIGVTGMRVGGLRRLTIPPELAYGAQGVGPIPPNATLIFEVELLAVQ
jgi:FKBP-type peptidyl-prolyl cis-trans isomerase FkpA